jgi:hypothetical protein
MNKELSIQKIFKPYIAKRKNGQCQVLIPLVELDEVCDAILKLFKEMIGDDEEVKGYDHTCGDFNCSGCQVEGRNRLRAELRNAINTEGGVDD